MTTTNFIKKIFDKQITEEVHNAFTRYSLGEFEKEPVEIKVGKKDVKVQTGFEYLNFLHRFLTENLKGEVEIDGSIESVRDISPVLNKYKIDFEDKSRFGKSGKKYMFTAKVSADTYKKLVEELFGEYLLFNVNFEGGKLKVKKQNTPKLGSPTDNFVTVNLPHSLMPALKSDYLFDVEAKDFTALTINNHYHVENINLDEKLLMKDAALARKQATREGEISRKITVDGKVVKDYKIKFKV
ncbi:MAG: hypothetical protein WCV90_00670 [Candidatus Woesearchaeota archaeon]|jgi:hypothetical protein